MLLLFQFSPVQCLHWLSADIPSTLSECLSVTQFALQDCSPMTNVSATILKSVTLFLLFLLQFQSHLQWAPLRLLCSTQLYSTRAVREMRLVSSGVMACRSRQREALSVCWDGDALHLPSPCGTEVDVAHRSDCPTDRPDARMIPNGNQFPASWRPHAFAARLSSTLSWLSLRSL